LVPVHPRLKQHVERVFGERCAYGGEARLFPLVGTYVDEERDIIRWGHGWSNHYNDHAKKIWPKMHVHCWRSYAVTEMSRKGIVEEVRCKLIGHALSSVHAGYNQVDLRRLVEAVYAIP
jgi:hypothetical protein